MRTARPRKAAASRAKAPIRASAAFGLRIPSSPAAATISGEGVSPAASAAASGSPPGSAAATASAEGGRWRGSRSRQRSTARSTAGSRPSTRAVGRVGEDSSRNRRISSAESASKAGLPVKSS